MTVDELIAALQSVRAEHGGGLPVAYVDDMCVMRVAEVAVGPASFGYGESPPENICELVTGDRGRIGSGPYVEVGRPLADALAEWHRDR